jgi:micrococcal nuclease
VDHVVDGDTVDVVIAGVRERVRLIGIDTPEIAHGEDPGECGGPDAARYLESVIPPGTEVTVLRDIVGRDHYGRLLGYLTKQDIMVNLQIAAAGYARALRIPPNVRLSDEISSAVDAAQRAQLGIWSTCA